jgi:hypothetical protein
LSHFATLGPEVRDLTKEAIEGGLDALKEYRQEDPHRMTMTTEAVRQALGEWVAEQNQGGRSNSKAADANRKA